MRKAKPTISQLPDFAYDVPPVANSSYQDRFRADGVLMNLQVSCLLNS